MLPFLKRRDQGGQTGLIVKTRQPDEKPVDDKDDPDASLEACGRDILSAIERKDAKALSEALCDLFYIADSKPHEEGEHVSPHSYDAQNQKVSENE